MFASRRAICEMPAGVCRDVDSTPAETTLEDLLNQLGNGALRGEFKRQWPVGDWIVDFYFPDIKLAIEVDGGYHRALSRWRRDQHKTRDLQARGITLLRLANGEVVGERERLIARLRAAWRAARERSRQERFSLREPASPAYLKHARCRRCFRLRPLWRLPCFVRCDRCTLSVAT